MIGVSCGSCETGRGRNRMVCCEFAQYKLFEEEENQTIKSETLWIDHWGVFGRKNGCQGWKWVELRWEDGLGLEAVKMGRRGRELSGLEPAGTFRRQFSAGWTQCPHWSIHCLYSHTGLPSICIVLPSLDQLCLLYIKVCALIALFNCTYIKLRTRGLKNYTYMKLPKLTYTEREESSKNMYWAFRLVHNISFLHLIICQLP